MQLDAPLLAVLQYLDRQGEIRGEVRPPRGARYLEARTEAVELLALFRGDQARESLGIVLYPLRDRVAGGLARLVGGGAPSLEGG